MNLRHGGLGIRILEKIHNCGRISFNDLLEKVQDEEPVARSTFNLCLKGLETNDLVKASERLAGRRVYYNVTDSALRQLSLFGSPEQNNAQNIQEPSQLWGLYHLLFYFAVNRPEYRLNTDEDLEKFLKTIEASMTELKVDQQFRPVRPPYCLRNIYYYDLLVTRYKHLKMKCFDGTSEEVFVRREDHRCYSLSNKSDYVFTVEQQEETQEPTSKGLGREDHVYYVLLPGIAASDISRTRLRIFEHLGKTEQEINRALERLSNAKLIKPIAAVNNDIRYSIVDSRLGKLLREYLDLFKFVTGLLIRIWDDFRRPTYKEHEWFSKLYGEQVAYESFRVRYKNRKALRNNSLVKKCRVILDEGTTILKYHNMIPREFEKLEKEFSDIFKKYSDFPLNSLRNLLYPSFLENDALNDIKAKVDAAQKQLEQMNSKII